MYSDRPRPFGRTERYDTIVIGAGQAGLAVGHYLMKDDADFVLLESAARIGESWRRRWDSLRLTTPAHSDALPGMPFPALADYLPYKDEVANYLERYADRFEIPVRTGSCVSTLRRVGQRYRIDNGTVHYEASNVIVATGAYQKPRIPALAAELAPHIRQLHSSAYRNPHTLPQGRVLVVGAGSAGKQIAREVSQARQVLLAGVGDTSGLARRGRVTEVQGGLPVADALPIDVDTIIWCTGFSADFSWIQIPLVIDAGLPRTTRGVVPESPGLYFVGLPFLSGRTSSLIGGVGADAAHIAGHVAGRTEPDARAASGRQVTLPLTRKIGPP